MEWRQNQSTPETAVPDITYGLDVLLTVNTEKSTDRRVSATGTIVLVSTFTLTCLIFYVTYSGMAMYVGCYDMLSYKNNWYLQVSYCVDFVDQ